MKKSAKIMKKGAKFVCACIDGHVDTSKISHSNNIVYNYTQIKT